MRDEQTSIDTLMKGSEVMGRFGIKETNLEGLMALDIAKKKRNDCV